MGEIGIPYRDYLYELQFWQLLLIARGYHARHHAGWEQARLIAYHAAYAFGSKSPPPSVLDWLTFPWEEGHDTILTEGTIQKLRETIQAENQRREAIR